MEGKKEDETERQYSCLALLQQRCSKDAIIERFFTEFGVEIPMAQEQFLHMLQASLEHSPPNAWLRTLTKAVVDLIERSGESCLDELVELAITSSLSTQSSAEFDNSMIDSKSGHDVYQLQTRKIAIRKMKMHNEVGTKIWTAGVFLSEFCAQNSYLFNNADVVELGAGVGITGLTLAANDSPPSRVIMTDFSDDTMENLNYNLALNAEDSTSSKKLAPITAKRLDWALCTDAETIQTSLEFDPRKIDVFLAADCVYSPDLCLLLVSALEAMLPIASANRPAHHPSGYQPTYPPFLNEDYPFAIVASTVRDPDTFSLFLKTLEDSFLTCTEITKWAYECTDVGAFFIPNYESHTDEVVVHCLQCIPP
jgi:predicted nicotinamide N-methyase